MCVCVSLRQTGGLDLSLATAELIPARRQESGLRLAVSEKKKRETNDTTSIKTAHLPNTEGG